MKRLGSQRKKIERLSKREEGKLITAILIMLDTDEELTIEHSYKVVVWFACRSATAQDPRKRADLEKYAIEFVGALKACNGIEVGEHELRGHFDITLEDLEVMKRFDFDFRSEAPKPGGEMAPATDG